MLHECDIYCVKLAGMMQKEKYQSQPLVFHEGYYIKRQFNGFEALQENAKNWEHHCTYQLQPNALAGEHQVLQLHSMQLLHAQRRGGFMHNIATACDCISVAVVEECGDKACFDRLKLRRGDILFFDDSRSFSYMSSGAGRFTVLTIPKSALGPLLPKLPQVLDHLIRDTDGVFETILRQTLERFGDGANAQRDTKEFREAEEKICAVLMKLLEEQTPVIPKLTRGEVIAFDIRDQVNEHMDGKISIDSFARQYQVSRQTLRKSFKSLFGFSPQHFFRQLKLNHVQYDLKLADPQNETVSRIAHKWGFMHMGRFSEYYTALFGESPSQTLNSPSPNNESMAKSCVGRQEEI